MASRLLQGKHIHDLWESENLSWATNNRLPILVLNPRREDLGVYFKNKGHSPRFSLWAYNILPMRITIKSLQQKIESLENEKSRYFNLWQKAKEELDGRNEVKRMERNFEENSTRREVGNLMQIIRILAKDPTLTMIPTQDELNNDRYHR